MTDRDPRALVKTRPPGLREIAISAGVSITTVERVLNERGSVSPSTRDKVLHAAQGIGLRRIVPSASIGNRVIEAVLPINRTPYWALLSQSLKEIAPRLPRGVTLHRTFIAQNNPAGLSSAIQKSSVKRSALIVAAEINEAVEESIRLAMERGEIVISIGTKPSGLPTHAFSGIDNSMAGRTAARLINFGSPTRSGLVLVLQANTSMQWHRDRVAGFLDTLDKKHFVKTIVTDEVDGESYRVLSALLADGQAPVAIYETGDPGDEIAPLLRNMPEPPIWIGHEQNEVHDALLKEGLLHFVLDQDPREQAGWALALILEQLGIANLMPARKPELRIFTAENVLIDHQ